MVNKFKKFLIFGVVLIMSLGLFAGCTDNIVTDEVSVMIKAEYREKFESEEFTVDDFKWNNVDEIVYNQWYENGNKGWVTITLKKHGKKQVNDAVKHFKTLDFVDSADTIAKAKAF